MFCWVVLLYNFTCCLYLDSNATKFVKKNYSDTTYQIYVLDNESTRLVLTKSKAGSRLCSPQACACFVTPSSDNTHKLQSLPFLFCIFDSTTQTTTEN